MNVLNKLFIILFLVTIVSISAQEVIEFKGTIFNRPLLEVTVNSEGSYDFALDIGASGIGRINKPLYDEFNFPIIGTEMNSDGINTRAEKTVKVDQLSIGSLMIKDSELIMRDYGAPISGILGRDFFAEKTLTIDFPNNRIILNDKPLDQKFTKNILTYERPFWIEGKIGDLSTQFNLDTGSSGGFVLPKSLLIKNNINFEETGIKKEGKRTYTNVELTEVKLLDNIELGGIIFQNPIVLINDELNEINVGSKILKDFIITIDQKSKLIKFTK